MEAEAARLPAAFRSRGGGEGRDEQAPRRVAAEETRITRWVLLAVLSANALAIPGAGRFVRLRGRRTREDGSVYYVKSQDDLYLVAFHVVLFAFLRSAAMTYVFVPFAQRWFARERSGRETQRAAAPAARKAEAVLAEDARRGSLLSSYAKAPSAPPKSVRFAEQGWVFLYYSVYWSIGMYVMYHSPTWYYRTEKFWEGYPHLEMSALQKWYYLSQAGFWISQHWVVQTETKRKDHFEMVLHHLVTSALITSSYILNFTRIGTAVFVMMDTSDTLLPVGGPSRR
ncbi:MAG: TLC domain-containing protein [Olpidium bornovanus]|uniref:TLC domain-containing protein n=1 Tax=Olpidium bornovanus TaxID=278681 RepID=A0A8H7ZUD1_9FUNG|nr:MAG: TLC domain-containing protein [Olpidium bornovanus]